jgi:hypothetical protein
MFIMLKGLTVFHPEDADSQFFQHKYCFHHTTNTVSHNTVMFMLSLVFKYQYGSVIPCFYYCGFFALTEETDSPRVN